MADRTRFFPQAEPYDAGILPVGDGNELYWEVCGNPDGVAALVVHGGPGSGCVPGMRQLFDPNTYRVVLFDQRGCGRSTPHASDPAVDLHTNTTDHLIGDIELLRQHLGVSRWVIAGWSWGTTLALAYAELHPDRVAAMVLTAVTTTTEREVRWITRDVGRLFPAEWAQFRAAVPGSGCDGSLADGYARLLNDPDPEVRHKAALDWCRWEDAHVNLGPQPRPRLAIADPDFRMCFARLVTHYWRHFAWRGPTELLDNVTSVAHIPAALIHGRLDVSGPLDIAWQLHQAWPASQLHIVAGMGHESGGAMADLGIEALNEFAEIGRTTPTTVAEGTVEQPGVGELLAFAVGKGPDRVNAAIRRYRDDASTSLLVARSGRSVVAVLGYALSSGQATILHIATAPHVRRSGIATLLLTELRRRLPVGFLVVAETDADAVDFYRVNGFSVNPLGEKYAGVERFRVMRRG